MSIMSRHPDRSFPILENWLDRNKNDPNAYIDIREIRDPEHHRRSAYVDEMLSEMGMSRDDVQVRSNFIPNGFRINTALSYDANGNPLNDGVVTINCQYEGDFEPKIRRFAAYVTHPDRITRVYAQHTTARDMEFVGYGDA